MSSCAHISRMSYLGLRGGRRGTDISRQNKPWGTNLCTIPLHIPYKYPLWVCDREMWVFVEFTKNSQGHHNERGYVRHLSGLRQFRLLPPFSNIRPRYARWTVHYNPVVMATGTLSTSPQLDSYIFTKLIIIISLIVSKGQLTWLPMNQWTMNIVITCFHGVISYWRSSVGAQRSVGAPPPLSTGPGRHQCHSFMW